MGGQLVLEQAANDAFFDEQGFLGIVPSSSTA